jgi:hypothetical protein
MPDMRKPIELLRPVDLQACAVWEYTNDDREGETVVRSIKQVPVADLPGKVVGTQVRLASGRSAWALIGNVDLRSARWTEHFLTLSIEHAGRWFTLARYHDHDFDERGPEGLARFLGLRLEDVFPIDYDIRQYANGDSGVLSGQVRREPRERLSRGEIIALAIP